MRMSEPGNPLAEGLERLPVHPSTLTIFGATGDLAQRKLLPAIYNLAHDGALPETFNLVGASFDPMSRDEFREQATKWIGEFSRRDVDPAVLEALLDRAHYVAGSFDEDELFEQLDAIGAQLDIEAGSPLNRIHYLSTS